jgi:GWxTD domain-containing protein
MIFYFELYRGDDMDDKVVLETMLRGKVAGMVYRDTIHVELTEPVLKQNKNISLDGFKAGGYELYLRLRGRRGKMLTEVRRQFEVRWSQRALLKHDYERALDQLGLIAGPGEINKLKKLKTYEERVVGFDNFWRERDPAKETPENEAKATFYRRIAVANRVFSYIYREGWRTDRGRIYVQFGEPDQIDDYPLSHDAHPYQLWHYYRDGRYRRFTFVDENEDGDYRLIYPYDGLGLRPDF